MAQFYFGEMSQDLIPAAAEGPQIYYQPHALLPFNRWAPKFYYHLDSFLAATRSVDLVITTTFGIDRMLEQKKWIDTLPLFEQANRKAFEKEYASIAGNFRRHRLSHIRNLSVHRSGKPEVEVAILGRWGEYYRGGPIQSLPTFEQPTRLTPNGPDDPLSWMQPVRFPIEPQRDEFFVQEALENGGSRKHPLFSSCEEYLQSASQLVEQARSLAERVHTHPVTPPPLYELG
jgi:hypothetical protein